MLKSAVDVFGTSTNVCELSKKIQNLSMITIFVNLGLLGILRQLQI